MKNQNIQFNATALRCKSSRGPAVAGLLTPLLLCFALFFSATTHATAAIRSHLMGLSRGKYLQTSVHRCRALAAAFLTSS